MRSTQAMVDMQSGIIRGNYLKIVDVCLFSSTLGSIRIADGQIVRYVFEGRMLSNVSVSVISASFVRMDIVGVVRMGEVLAIFDVHDNNLDPISEHISILHAFVIVGMYLVGFLDLSIFIIYDPYGLVRIIVRDRNRMVVVVAHL